MLKNLLFGSKDKSLASLPLPEQQRRQLRKLEEMMGRGALIAVGTPDFFTFTLNAPVGKIMVYLVFPNLGSTIKTMMAPIFLLPYPVRQKIVQPITYAVKGILEQFCAGRSLEIREKILACQCMLLPPALFKWPNCTLVKMYKELLECWRNEPPSLIPEHQMQRSGHGSATVDDAEKVRNSSSVVSQANRSRANTTAAPNNALVLEHNSSAVDEQFAALSLNNIHELDALSIAELQDLIDDEDKFELFAHSLDKVKALTNMEDKLLDDIEMLLQSLQNEIAQKRLVELVSNIEATQQELQSAQEALHSAQEREQCVLLQYSHPILMQQLRVKINEAAEYSESTLRAYRFRHEVLPPLHDDGRVEEDENPVESESDLYAEFIYSYFRTRRLFHERSLKLELLSTST